MSNQNKLILVFGATGNQGGAAVEELLAQGWKVRAVSRRLDTPVVQELQNKGAQVVQANLDDRQSLLEAMVGVYGVYMVQPIINDDPEKELQQGKNVLDMAKKAGIFHFIYSSAGGVDRNRGGAHFDIMWQIEQYIREMDLPYTMLRPAFFMENFKRVVQVQDAQLLIPEFINANTAFQMISSKDIAAFAVIAFNQPENFTREAVEIAGDEISLTQVKQLFSQLFDIPTKILETPRGQFPGREWLEQVGYQADIHALREIHPGLLDLKSWVRISDWNPRNC
ncbi:NmrA/HSCARG family protein [Paenibacillus wynnii]|uniref:NmrA-like domain-containing protein n=1 Tax=Paenibacillus wynnii TaxID=268407 RepID=A0A098M8F7_9BACL|nr:NmrA/HSCARG family protein [Paenibacillus wynnii]KGE18835.1 hypothetical protein PWYN_05295 [Paenibacillus wynnii]